MNLFKNETITFRLTVKYTLFIFVTLVVMSLITLLTVYFYVYNQADNQLINIGETLKNELSNSSDLTGNQLESISKMNENIDVNIRKDNELIFNSGEDYDLTVPISVSNDYESYEFGENNLIYRNYKVSSSKNINFIIQVIKDMDSERYFIKILFWVLLIINIIVFCVSVFFGYYMSKKALNPIKEIILQAQKMTVTELNQRIEINGPDDEIKALAETFNQMLSRIQIGYDKQNRFSLDASHELATPLAVINGYLDIIGKWGKNDAKVLDEAITVMKKKVLNITKLLDRLLFLAKGDNELSKIEKNLFWVNELMVEILKNVKLIYPKHNFELQVNQSIKFHADESLIRQMIRALIDNSVKYSKSGTTISLSCRQSGKFCELVIKDEGIGISPKNQKRIFDRFYRVDKSRTRKTGGFGLGLSIVKWIVDIHLGTIHVESEVNKGTKVEIRLPVKNL